MSIIKLAKAIDFRESLAAFCTIPRSYVMIDVPVSRTGPNRSLPRMSTESSQTSTNGLGTNPGTFRVGPTSQQRNDTADATPAGPIDQQLVRETRNQIRSMVDEITALADSDCTEEEFYQGFLTRTTSALASIGGAIWRVGDGGKLILEYQINVSQSGLTSEESNQQAHGKLLRQLIDSGELALIPPRSGAGDPDGASNPTENLLVVGPLSVDSKVVGLVEIFQRPDSGPTTQRGYLRFLAQMCKIASDYLKNHQLREYSDQQSNWQRVQSFVRSIHGSLNTKDTIYAIANEGRRVIDCDRVSVALYQGRRMQVQTMSGLDTIERRAEQVKKLSKLSTVVSRAGEPMWYAGDDADLPPQIEQALHEYLDIAHSKLLVIEPLRETVPFAGGDEDPSDSKRDEGKIIGALIAEQLGDDRLSPLISQRIETVVGHGSDALTNSLVHSGMFLAPLWTAIGKTRAVTTARNLPKTVFCAAVLAILAAAMCFIQRPFTLGATGQLVPVNRSEVYANVDGVLQQINVPANPEDPVEANQVLAVMTNNDLMVQIKNLQGQMLQANEEAKKLQRAQHSQMNQLEHRMIEGDLAEALELKDSLKRQLDLKFMEADLLNVRAPCSGQVVNWQLRQNLLRRPVQRGQNLMTIVDPNTPWHVELEFPERRVSHLARTMKESNEPALVTFTLASYPGQQFSGRLHSVDNKFDVRSDEGNSVLVRVAFDKSQLPTELMRSGTRVTAQIHAGHRSVGYIWFRELFETVQSTWILWF